MSMMWKKKKISDIITVKKGSYITKKQSTLGPYPVILGGQEPAYYINKYNHTGKAIVISRSGASAGFVSYWNEPIFITDGFLIEPNEDVEHDYLYYLLKNNQGQLHSVQGGAAIPHVTPAKIGSIDILLPPNEVQCRIQNILSAYDDLIENNQKQIKLLEEAAQRLYKEWFVDFHFPGHEDVNILNGIPKGWEKIYVGELIGHPAVTRQIMASDYLTNGLIPVIDQSRSFIAGYTNDVESVVKSDVPVIVFGDHTRILKFIQFPFAKGADGTQLIITANDNMPQRLLYCSLINLDISNYHYARHFKYLKAEKIVVPDHETAKKFETNMTPIFDEIQSKRNIINLANEARDRLLPKLMSGEIEV